jgi:exonuclease SbcC
MKPLKLIMSAFGSYADTQTIDFTRLGANGLYLITGETGSGKTTIFDAISYALFGESSGQMRDSKMLRSDFADEEKKTFVELEFEVRNQKYTVRRTQKYQKKDGKKLTDDVELSLPDGTRFGKIAEVDDKISNVIGLDRDQFAQIVMIAQNDFLRFLQSGTDERVKILRRIFDTGRYKYFQENLKARAKELSGELDSYRRDFELHEVDPYKRDEKFAEWEAQVKIDKTAIEKADEELIKHDATKTKLAGEIAVAEGLIKQFNDLAAERQALDMHNAKAGEMTTLSLRQKRGEIALRRVKPLADKAAETGKQYAEAQYGLAAAKSDAETAQSAFDQAKKTLAELPPIDEAQTAFDALGSEWKQTAENHEKLTVLKTDYGVITGKRKEIVTTQAEFEKLNIDYTAKNKNYETVNETFLRGQAGILASHLSDGEPCPVCGSTEHPVPAHLLDGDLSEEKVNAAKDTADKAREKRDSKSTECAKLNSQLETLQARFDHDLAEQNVTENTLDDTLLQTKTAVTDLTAKKSAGEKSLTALKANWESAAKQHTDSNAALKSAQTLVTEREANEKKQSKLCEEARAAYQDALSANGFAVEAEYIAALVAEDGLSKMIKQLSDYEKEGEWLDAEIKRLTTETRDKAKPDLEKLTTEADAVNALIAELRGKRDEVKSRLEQTERVLTELRRSAAHFAKLEKQCAAVKQLSEIANGKLDFETYVQTAYFERVLRAANLRLKLMSQNRYTLQRKTDSDDGRKKSGLELEVSDTYTGKSRSANSLSGGESFMASLSLALGLSDVVQQSAGGIRLDAMFVDEGFGSLDADVLELAVKTLSEMADDGRIIGIISHVAELRERIDKQIRVVKTPVGSRLSIVI